MSADDSSNVTALQVGANGLDADDDEDARTWAALWRLPARFRRVILLRDVAGLPMGEAAKRLGLSRATAERRWMRGIVLLSEQLAKMERGREG